MIRNLIIFFLLKSNLFDCSIVSMFQYKYDIFSNKSFTASSAFSSFAYKTSTENLDFLRCLRFCNNYASCFSMIYTKYNNSYSLCSLYNNYPSPTTDLILSQNVVLNQKILYRKSKVLNLIL